MAKYIFYILLGLFLISKLTSAGGGEIEEYKVAHTINLQYTPEYLCSKSEADIRQYNKDTGDQNYSSRTDAGNIGISSSFRCASPFKLLRTDASFILSKIVKSIKYLLPEEKTNSFSFSITPNKTSYRYYVYALRHILV